MTALVLLHHPPGSLSFSLPSPHFLSSAADPHSHLSLITPLLTAHLTTTCSVQAQKADRFLSPMAVEIDASLRDGPALDDDEDNLSDASSSLTEIGSQEFPSFFVERDERLFPSHGDPPYPFPVDGDEQHVRVSRSHSRTLPLLTCQSSPLTNHISYSCGSHCHQFNGMHIANECPTRFA